MIMATLPFVQSPAERYAAEHYATPEARAAHARSGRRPAAEDACEWCEASPCEDACECPECETSRALDDDADAYAYGY